jgi:alginate O-acetyltransferase complex protein AlgI
MLFNSIEFLIFFPLVTLIYFMLPHKLRWLHLLIASCVFYMFFIPVYILILFGTIVIDYAVGIWIENAGQSRKKTYLILSLIANIGILAVFKYYNFFIENVNQLLASINYTVQPLPYLSIILPIGLSFHTFQAMSYTLEVYRGEQKAERHFGIYALYVMFYPQLVAGPIERPQNMLHQFHEKHEFNQFEFFAGLRLMLWGLFKKVVIADRLSIYVDAIYANPDGYHVINVALALFFFAIQIYCDFSGYSDIALGSARTMGFKLMLNFNRPFISKNVSELWRRWHISLSTWFNDYLYMPIVMGLRDWGKNAVFIALFITFFLSGLWHGAAWTFVLYGCTQGVAVIWDLLTKKRKKKIAGFLGSFIYDNLSVILTFTFSCFCWVLFRAETLAVAGKVYSSIFTFDTSSALVLSVVAPSMIEFGITSMFISFVMIVILFSVEKFFSPDFKELDSTSTRDISFSVAILTLVIVLGVFQQNSFIYFQF